MSPSPWSVDRCRGEAATFHDRPWPDPLVRAVWWFEADGPTVVLGSTQRHELIDSDRARAGGVRVVTRRSGGGAVWLAPGEVTWVDVLVPVVDPLWVNDVGRASHWLGQAWSSTLADLGIGGTVVHRSGMVRTEWSDLVCFAGLGPGEVTLRGAKVVGISQRRTRAGARFQCALVHRWDPVPLLDVLALSDPERQRARRELTDVAAGVTVDPADVVAALVANLP